MLRRQIVPAVLMLAALAVLTGLAYPIAVWAVGQVTFRHQANGSFFTHDGTVAGSALLGQNFSDANGNPLPQYFQPRPSAAGNGYDASASSATNLGPGDPRLVGFIPRFNAVDLSGNASDTNPFATPADPNCVPTDPKGLAIISPAAGQAYAKNSDGTYVCYPNTVPERTITYRQFNNIPDGVAVPVDAVTASGSGLDPDISVANADLQAPRVAAARKLSLDQVLSAVRANTHARQWLILGEERVDVVALNMALDGLH